MNKEKLEQIECCFCAELIPIVGGTWAEGNNAEPAKKGGRCCNECNASIVIPARMNERMRMRAAN